MHPIDKNAVDGDVTTGFKEQRDAIAGEFQAKKTSFTDGKVTGKVNTASFAYCKNDDKEYLNKGVGNKSASEVVAHLYEPYIIDGSFYEQLNVLLPFILRRQIRVK